MWASPMFRESYAFLNEVPEHMAQEFGHVLLLDNRRLWLLNEVPEHMAQELIHRGASAVNAYVLNEVPEHMAQELDA